jgi:hypothetical protein
MAGFSHWRLISFSLADFRPGVGRPKKCGRNTSGPSRLLRNGLNSQCAKIDGHFFEVLSEVFAF